MSQQQGVLQNPENMLVFSLLQYPLDNSFSPNELKTKKVKESLQKPVMFHCKTIENN
jgi:hypothetical protein